MTNGVTVCGAAFVDPPVASLHCKTEVQSIPLLFRSTVLEKHPVFGPGALERERSLPRGVVFLVPAAAAAAPCVAKHRGFLFTLLYPNILLQTLCVVT